MNLSGGAMALTQPLLASGGGQLQDRSVGRFIGVHMQDGGVAFRGLDADLHFMEGCNEGRALRTEPDPDLLFKPSTIHGANLHSSDLLTTLSNQAGGPPPTPLDLMPEPLQPTQQIGSTLLRKSLPEGIDPSQHRTEVRQVAVPWLACRLAQEPVGL